jgi:hypothetical protein
MMPAPQGRAYQKKKRSNHVTIIVDTKVITNKKSNDIENKRYVDNKIEPWVKKQIQ